MAERTAHIRILPENVKRWRDYQKRHPWVSSLAMVANHALATWFETNINSKAGKQSEEKP